MQKLILACGFLTTLIIACQQRDPEGFMRTPSGLFYKINSESGDTTTAATGDILVMDISYSNDLDSVLFDSKQRSDSFTVVLKSPTFKGGVEEGFAMMHPGDNYQFKAPSDSVFLKTFLHPQLPTYAIKGGNIYFHVHLHRIIPRFQADSISRARDIEYRSTEFERIGAYLKENDMDVVPTENGVYIRTLRTGNGKIATSGDTVEVYYKGRTIEGIPFDSVIPPGKPFQFVAGTGMVIAGWEDAFKILDEGSESRIVVPSDLAYGDRQFGKLPPYSTLVFEIRLQRIISGKK